MASKDEIRDLLNEQTENFKTVLATTKAEIINVMNTKISEVKANVAKLEIENNTLRTKVTGLENLMARMAKNNEVIIHHIPSIADENLCLIFGAIAETIGFNIVYMPHLYRLHNAKKNPIQVNKPSSLRSTRRMRTDSSSESESSNSCPAILVKFFSTLEKHNFMQLYFKFQSLNLTHVGFLTPKRIIIGDNLTLSNHRIFKAAMEFKKAGKIIKIRVTDGLVSISNDTSGKFKIVSTLEDLSMIINQ